MFNIWASAVAAGSVAILSTVAVERLGGRKGGLVATLPTTIVPASIGIAAASSDPGPFVDSMSSIPAGMWVNVVFLLCWRVFPQHLPTGTLLQRLMMMVGVAMGVWVLLATVLVWGLHSVTAWGGTVVDVGRVSAAGTLGLGLFATWSARPAPAGQRAVSPWVLASRGVLAALAVAAAVGLASVAGPLIAGVAAVFPAIFLTSMVSLWWSQGEAVQGGAVGPMMLGASSVSAYALLAADLFPLFGPTWGAVAAWLGAVTLLTLPSSAYLRWRSGVAVARGNQTAGLG